MQTLRLSCHTVNATQKKIFTLKEKSWRDVLVTEGMKQSTVVLKQEYEVLNTDVPVNVTV